MTQSESIAKLVLALVKAQSEFPAIPRNKEVTVTGQRGSYKFSYAPFEDILRAVKPHLHGNGLGFTQSANGDKLITTILHESGEWMEREIGIINPSGTAQSYGSALTYSRRYGFCAAFGIQADDDDDANAADGNTVTQTKERGTAKPGTPEEQKRAAFEDASPEQQEFLRKIAADIAALLTEDRADDAYGFLEAQRLELEEKMGLWFLLDSKQRAALKKSGERADLERRASERSRHQQSRPETRIPQ